VRYNPRARLNRGQVEVRGDGGGGGGMGFPGLGSGGSGMKVGGGIGGLIIVVIIILLGGGNLLGGGASDTGNGATTGPQPNCQTGADANKSLVCALTAAFFGQCRHRHANQATLARWAQLRIQAPKFTGRAAASGDLHHVAVCGGKWRWGQSR